MFTKFNLYIGLNDKDTKQQEILTTDAYKIVGGIVGDCTITEGKGLYTHTDGTRPNNRLQRRFGYWSYR